MKPKDIPDHQKKLFYISYTFKGVRMPFNAPLPECESVEGSLNRGLSFFKKASEEYRMILKE
jgi:hypothetical protein